MRWRMVLVGLTLACGLITGCRQQLFLAEKDLNQVRLLPAEVERNPLEALVPRIDSVLTPPDVNNPDRPPRHMTLQEAIAISLENGTPSGQQGVGFNRGGQIDDTLVSSARGFNQTSENIRVLALNPALSQAAIENQLARFDAQWITSMNWTTTDSLQQGLQSFQNGSSAAFATSFIKAMPTGGTANVSFLTDYRILNNPPTGLFGVLNPQYTSRLVFGIDHPLWRDYGSEINQLLTRHPSSSPFSPIPPTHAGSFAGHINSLSPFASIPEGILVARIRHEQQKAEFERQLNFVVLNVEIAYWNLYKAYGQLYSFEEVMRIAHKSWMINKAKFDNGTVGPATYYPILGQYEEFRGERLSALANVIEAERNLRGIMGLPIEDKTRIVPVTPPNMAQYQPNFEAAIRDSLVYRPEMALVRENLRVAHYQLIREKNQLKPDLRGAAQYSPVGFGNRLDGNGSFVDGTNTTRPNNALDSLSSGHFNDWSIGLILNVPLGYRAEMANVRAARLSLAQSYYVLLDQEERCKRVVTQQWQDLSKWYGLIATRRAERKAYAETVEARFKEFAAGKATAADFLPEAQRRLATSQVKEYEAIAEYNNTLARLEWAKGTILHNNNVYISEGALPEHVQKRAVEHERERTKAHLLHYKPLPVTHPGQLVSGSVEVVGDPVSVGLPAPTDIKLSPELLNMPAPVVPSDVPAKSLPPAFLPAAAAPVKAPAKAPEIVVPNFSAAPAEVKRTEPKGASVAKGLVIIEDAPVAPLPIPDTIPAPLPEVLPGAVRSAPVALPEFPAIILPSSPPTTKRE